MRRYHDLEKTIAIPHHASSVIPGTTLVIDQFEDHVVEMYTNILEYQLRLVIFYQRSEFTKIARHTDDWQGLLTTIRKLERESRKDKDVMNDGILKDLHEDVWDNMKSALSTNYEDTKLLVEVAVAGMHRTALGIEGLTLIDCRHLRLVHKYNKLRTVEMWSYAIHVSDRWSL